MNPKVSAVISSCEEAGGVGDRLKSLPAVSVSPPPSSDMIPVGNVEEDKPVECKPENPGGVASPVCSPNPAGLPTLVDGRYLLGDKVWHSPTHRKCVDIITREHFLCQVTSREPDVTKLPSFVAHMRLEGHSGVNPIQKIVVDSAQTYVLYRAWDPKMAAPHDLQGLLQTRRRLSEAHCRLYFRQIATLVRDSHEAGIVLRDLKLRKFVFKDVRRREVCMETLEDAVVLGMEDPRSKTITGNDMLTDRWRCVPYCPPEILNSRKAPYSGRKADLWSLGVILYTMLVGRYPFSAAKDPTVVSRIRRGTFVIPPHVSHEAACLVRSLLQREPDARISAAQCLLHPWVSRHRCRSRVCDGFGRQDCCWDEDGPGDAVIFERYVPSLDEVPKPPPMLLAPLVPNHV